MLHLESLRASEPQSIAMKNYKEERSRQSENQKRQRTLHSACLTSHRLRRIATPILYASFTGTSTWKGMEHLKLFHRTIFGCDTSATHRVPLSNCIRYIENRLSDHEGNNLYEDAEGYDSVQMTARYFCLLSEIVKKSPNLQHLNVVSLEVEDVSFWKFFKSGTTAADSLIDHAESCDVPFRKLETLCFQTNTPGIRVRSTDVSVAQISLAMAFAPLLQHFQACGIIAINDPSVAMSTALAPLRRLQRLEITRCLLDFEDLLEVWGACEGLRHITCEWAYLDSPFELPSYLLPGLLRHAETLRTLHLDMREVRFELPRPPEPPLFGSLRAFVNLRSLTLCERFTSDDHYVWNGRLADLLPANLEKLTVLRHPDGLYEYGSHEDRIRNLRHLAQDCRPALPRLKRVAIHDVLQFQSSELHTLFNNAGVRFEIVRET
ncbi:hypothetical protein NX059_001931 [Plenodomus lindquistii]|nr:hypothetical protein NX059_001931 [Plenodomus lindquistii]